MVPGIGWLGPYAEQDAVPEEHTKVARGVVAMLSPDLGALHHGPIVELVRIRGKRTGYREWEIYRAAKTPKVWTSLDYLPGWHHFLEASSRTRLEQAYAHVLRGGTGIVSLNPQAPNKSFTKTKSIWVSRVLGTPIVCGGRPRAEPPELGDDRIRGRLRVRCPDPRASRVEHLERQNCRSYLADKSRQALQTEHGHSWRSS
jgi:hypothetical protein